MAARSDWWLLLPEPVRRLPADLVAVIAVTLLTTAVATLPVVSESTILRVVLGLPYVLFIPGYTFIAALFPEQASGPTSYDEDPSDADDNESGIDGIERVALSFGLSIAIVPLIGLVLNFTPFGIRLVPILVAVDLFTLGAVAVAANRRWALPPEERFRVPYRTWIADARAELFEPESRGDAALNVLLVLSIILAVRSVGYAVAVPKEGEQFTEFYVLTEGEDGELVADDYPVNYTVGQSKPVVVGIGNQEHSRENYTVVIQLQSVEYVNNGTVTSNVSNATNLSVTRRAELTRYRATLGHNTTSHRNVSLQPTFAGETQRIVFLLYKGDVPANPRIDNAYRELHLWVNVSE